MVHALVYPWKYPGYSLQDFIFPIVFDADWYSFVKPVFMLIEAAFDNEQRIIGS